MEAMGMILGGPVFAEWYWGPIFAAIFVGPPAIVLSALLTLLVNSAATKRGQPLTSGGLFGMFCALTLLSAGILVGLFFVRSRLGQFVPFFDGLVIVLAVGLIVMAAVFRRNNPVAPPGRDLVKSVRK